MTLGGRRVEAQRPRVRTADSEAEVQLSTYEHFADRDPLGRVVWNGCSPASRPAGTVARTSPSARTWRSGAVDVEELGPRSFVERTGEALGELRSRQLRDRRLAVMMLDRVDRTAAPSRPSRFRCCLPTALRCYPERDDHHPPLQLQHAAPPERDRPPIKARMRRAWRETDYERTLEQLQRLADELEHTHPDAAGSLREGMEETLTVIRLGIRGKLRRTLESTNPCESMIDTMRTTGASRSWRGCLVCRGTSVTTVPV